MSSTPVLRKTTTETCHYQLCNPLREVLQIINDNNSFNNCLRGKCIRYTCLVHSRMNQLIESVKIAGSSDPEY